MEVNDREHLKLAFAYDVVRHLVASDDAIDPAETRFVQEMFPWSMLESRGLVTKEGTFTPAFHAAVHEAREHLPVLLTAEEKLSLVSIFVDAAVADEVFASEEGKILLDAAGRLGLTTGEVFDHLGTLRTVGDLDLPEPEAE
jgi:hypothetical protein